MAIYFENYRLIPEIKLGCRICRVIYFYAELLMDFSMDGKDVIITDANGGKSKVTIDE